MKEKPKKSVRTWIALDPDLFPSVKWEDNEPTKVIIRLA